MGSPRHRDVVVAALVLIGTVLSLANVVLRHLDGGFALYPAVWFLAAVAGAQIARRALPGLDLGQTAIASVVGTALLLGTQLHRTGETLDAVALLRVGAAAVGAIVGALAAPRRRDEVSPVWWMLAAGYAGYGAAMLAARVFMLVFVDAIVASVIVGALLGSAAVMLATPARAGQCALGTAFVFASVALFRADGESVQDAIRFAFMGGILGAVGGALGAKVRDSRKPATNLPPAQVTRAPSDS
jgi:hypothetical protein